MLSPIKRIKKNNDSNKDANIPTALQIIQVQYKAICSKYKLPPGREMTKILNVLVIEKPDNPGAKGDFVAF